jgi:hypothetical protein
LRDPIDRPGLRIRERVPIADAWTAFNVDEPLFQQVNRAYAGGSGEARFVGNRV